MPEGTHLKTKKGCVEGVSNKFINERWTWDLEQHNSLSNQSFCLNSSWKFWLEECDKSTPVSLWLKTKDTWKVECISFFTEPLLCSYAGTSKDYGGKAPDPSSPK